MAKSASPSRFGGATHELILGGQKSGKSRAAETRAAQWLDAPGREAVLIATALAADAEMRQRIARHRSERALRVPGLATIEEPHDLASALRRQCAAQRLVVVDCLALWLTQLAMPPGGASAGQGEPATAIEQLLLALRGAPGPVVLVSNEIGFGVTPLSAQTRRFVDTLGSLHQALAGICGRVTLMVAGCELRVKETRR